MSSTGPTGVNGIFGQQGLGIRGPTGIQGPIGVTGPNFSAVGPSGPFGAAGPSQPFSGGIYSLSTYATGVTGLASPAGGDPTAVVVWQAALPNNVKGTSGLLSTYFDMTLNYPTTGTAFDYGVYIDGVSLGLGPTQRARYVQTGFSANLIGSNQTTLGINGPTAAFPLSIPATIPLLANNVQIRIANANATILSLTTSNVTAYTAAGSSNLYTSPSNAIGIIVYVWGCGGSPYQTNAGGPGGFASGYYQCISGTVFTAIVGSLGGGTTNFANGCGGQGVSGTLGAGGGFSGVFLGTSPSSNTNNPIAVAGGGGGCSQTASSNQWQGGAGGGLNGGTTFDAFSSVFSIDGQGGGGTQTSGQYGSSRWQSYQYVNTNGAGGGGYYGGGGGNGSQKAGGGGSGFIVGGLTYGTLLQGVGATSVRTSTDISTTVVAAATDVMKSFGYSGYGHGSGGSGLILIVPVIGSNTPLVNVDMRFATL